MPYEEIYELTKNVRYIFTVEEAILSGGFGENLMEKLKGRDVKIIPFGVEDQMIRAGTYMEQLVDSKLDADSIVSRIRSVL